MLKPSWSQSNPQSDRVVLKLQVKIFQILDVQILCNENFTVSSILFAIVKNEMDCTQTHFN